MFTGRRQVMTSSHRPAERWRKRKPRPRTKRPAPADDQSPRRKWWRATRRHLLPKSKNPWSKSRKRKNRWPRKRGHCDCGQEAQPGRHPADQPLVAEFLPLPDLDQSQLGGSKTLSRSYDSLKGVSNSRSCFPIKISWASARETRGESSIPQGEAWKKRWSWLASTFAPTPWTSPGMRVQ